MKKLISVACVGLFTFTSQAFADDLVQVYQQALQSDPTFQNAVATEQAAAEQFPQSLAALLPQVNFTGNGSVSKSLAQGSGQVLSVASEDRLTTSQRGYQYQLNVTQSIFDITNWYNLRTARASVKAAYATFAQAQQDLIYRTATAYFNVLQAEDILNFTGAEKQALYQRYVNAEQSYKVGLNTITDVYTAQAAYENTVAAYVSAQNAVQNAYEALRQITGHTYNQLAPLSDNFPLVSPNPNNIDTWVTQALENSWTVRAAEYSVESAHSNIEAERGGHFPTVSLQGNYLEQYTHTNGISQFGIDDNARSRGPEAEIDLTVPIFSGGAVTSQVREAIAQYEGADSQLVAAQRQTVENTRVAYLGVLAGISQVKADKQAIVSGISSLQGIEDGYKVGTNTILDVLDAQQNLFNSQTTYAKDRYQYVLNTLALKESAGSLSVNDLQAINVWLGTATSRPFSNAQGAQPHTDE